MTTPTALALLTDAIAAEQLAALLDRARAYRAEIADDASEEYLAGIDDLIAALAG